MLFFLAFNLLFAFLDLHFHLYEILNSKIDKTIKVWGYRESAHFITYRLSINDRIIRCSTYIIRDLMNFFYFKKYGRMPYTQ